MSKISFAVTTPPISEPISLADVKNFIRTIPDDDSEDEAIIIPLITAAREFLENATGRSLARQTLTASLQNFDTVRLPRPPFVSMDSVSYKDKDGNTIELDSTHYYLDDAEGILYFPSAPPVSELYPINPISVTYKTGYNELPKPLRQAMLMVIAHWYVNREAVQIGSRINEVAADFALQHIIHQYKVWWF